MQVFTNLLSNAIKHHDRPDGKIKISVKDLGRCYQFSVTDDCHKQSYSNTRPQQIFPQKLILLSAPL